MSVQDMHERLKKANERRNCGAEAELARLRAENAELVETNTELQDTIVAVFCVVFGKPIKTVEELTDFEFDELEKLVKAHGDKPSDTVKSVFEMLRVVIAELVDAMQVLIYSCGSMKSEAIAKARAALSRAEQAKPEVKK